MSNNRLLLLCALVLALSHLPANAHTQGQGDHANARANVQGHRRSQLSGENLIHAVCTPGELKCISLLQSAPQDQKADPTTLAIYILKFVEAQVVNLSSHCRNLQATTHPYLSPLL